MSEKNTRVGFVVHDGVLDDFIEGEPLEDLFPSMYFSGDGESVEDTLKEAQADFDERFQKGFATSNKGLYLIKIENVSEKDLEKLDDYDLVQKIIRNNWTGYTVTVQNKRKASSSDWLDSAFDDDGEDE